MDVHNYDVALMVIPEKKEIYPISTFAFNIAQSSKPNLKKYIGSLVFFKDGGVKKISSIGRKGFYGRSMIEKLKSYLVGAYDIEVQFQNAPVSFLEASSLIADYIVLDANSNNPSFEFSMGVDMVESSLRSSKAMEEVFEILSMPKLEDCLDIL